MQSFPWSMKNPSNIPSGKTTKELSMDEKMWVQQIVYSILYFILCPCCQYHPTHGTQHAALSAHHSALSAIVSKQSKATKYTTDTAEPLLNYHAAHSNNTPYLDAPKLKTKLLDTSSWGNQPESISQSSWMHQSLLLHFSSDSLLPHQLKPYLAIPLSLQKRQSHPCHSWRNRTYPTLHIDALQ